MTTNLIVYYSGVQTVTPHFSQLSYPTTLGFLDQGETIAAKGCALTALAMALAAEGVNTNPYLLNAVLVASEAYTRNNKVIWMDAVAAAAPGLRWVHTTTLTPDGIRSQIAQGRPVVAQVIGRQHFVLVTGTKGDNFIVNDPGISLGSKLIRTADELGSTRGYLVPRSTPLRSDDYADAPALSKAGEHVGGVVIVGAGASVVMVDEVGRRGGTDGLDRWSDIPNLEWFSDGVDDDLSDGVDGSLAHFLVLRQNGPVSFVLELQQEGDVEPELLIVFLDDQGDEWARVRLDSDEVGVGRLGVTANPETGERDVAALSPDRREQCLKGGWGTMGFRSQGQCIRFVNTGTDGR